jgi:hypothetical protein
VKLFSIALLFITNSLFAQKVELIKKATGSKESSLFLVKIFNDCSSSIAIKCSPDFNKFSESDTLELGYANGRYGLDVSYNESKTQSSGYYQLLLIDPQTYFITHISLHEFKNLSNPRFYLNYSTVLTNKEKEFFSKRDTTKIKVTKSPNFFLNKIIDLQ